MVLALDKTKRWEPTVGPEFVAQICSNTNYAVLGLTRPKNDTVAATAVTVD